MSSSNQSPSQERQPIGSSQSSETGQADALWDLLGRARQDVEVSADFALRTAAMARSMAQDGKDEAGQDRAIAAKVIAFPAWAWVRRAWIPTAAAAACVALLMVWQGQDAGPEDVTLVHQPAAPVEQTPDIGIPLEVEPWEWEFDEFAWMDQVVAVSDPAKLSDAELEFLLF